MAALKQVSPKNSLTPDGLPGIVLKKIGPTISYFLSLLFNLSLKSSKIPWQWKTGYITPIYKKSSRNNVNSYRPISITSTLSRLLEKIICNQLINHLHSNNLISPNQHGFLPQRSTSTQLVGALNEWINQYNENKPVHVIYTDIAKAFDSVSHPKLLEVVKSYGITDEILKWIECFLKDRTQHVRINNSFSDFLEVISGIPQGSVLGPLLFLLYMDDITKITSDETKVSLFADDAKFYSNNPNALQNTLNKAYDFFQTRQLSLAQEKCEHITFSKNKQDQDFRITNTIIKKCSLVKDLGVFISSDLKWESHVNNIKLRAFQRCYLILRSFSSKNIWTLLGLFKTFVRPILEYGSIIWSPQFAKDINSIESIQRYYTRRIFRRCKIPYQSYSDRLQKVKLRSLEYRRLEIDITMVYKIIHNLVDVPFENFFEFYTTPYNTRRHKWCLKLKRSVSRHQDSLFSRRIITVWNKLPSQIVECTTLQNFVTTLKKINLQDITNLTYY